MKTLLLVASILMAGCVAPKGAETRDDVASDPKACEGGDARACYRIFDALGDEERSAPKGIAAKRKVCKNPDTKCFSDPGKITPKDRERLAQDGFGDMAFSTWTEKGDWRSLTVFFRL